MSICLIKQPAGIGDIFYLQKFASIIRDSGYTVIWPLKDKLMWIKNYIPDIEFVSIDSQFPGKELYTSGEFAIELDNFLFLSPDGYQILGHRIMGSKYELIGHDDSDWVEYFKFNRNVEKEDDLYYNVLGLNDNSEYVYVNSYYNTDNYTTNIFADKEFKYPVIENKIINEYSLFDWCKVWENAKQIHTTPTSLCYILETLDTKSELFYYCRDQLQYVEHTPLFKKSINWIQ